MCHEVQKLRGYLVCHESLCANFHNMANFSVIDPRGDAILICGEAELQVSTKILSLASPVFSALFNPRFAEGQLVPCKPSHIKLPDDDAESMRFMCAVLHHKSTCANATGLERLERLAVLTNKYDVRSPPKILALTETHLPFAILEQRMRNRFRSSSIHNETLPSR